MGLFDYLAKLVTKTPSTERHSWTSEEDEENEGSTVYRLTSNGCQYIVQREWDDTWTWVKCDASSGDPLDMRINFPSREEAQQSAERDGGQSPG